MTKDKRIHKFFTILSLMCAVRIVGAIIVAVFIHVLIQITTEYVFVRVRICVGTLALLSVRWCVVFKIIDIDLPQFRKASTKLVNVRVRIGVGIRIRIGCISIFGSAIKPCRTRLHGPTLLLPSRMLVNCFSSTNPLNRTEN